MRPYFLRRISEKMRPEFILIKDFVTKWLNYDMYREFVKIDLKKLFGRFNEHSRIKIIRYDRSSLKSRKATSLFDIFLLKLSEIFFN
jgi:hypothetical protein